MSGAAGFETNQPLLHKMEFSCQILEHIGAAVIACDESGRVVVWNKTARDWLGTQDGPRADVPFGDKFIGMDDREPLPAEKLPLTRANCGETVVDVALLIAGRPNRPERAVLANAAPVFSADGARLGAVVVMHDITAGVQSDSALLLAKQRAEAASVAKSNFLSAMSHELRTPLNAILGFTQLLRRDALLSPEHVAHLDLINGGGEHLLHVINQTLDMSKIEAGEIPVEFTAFSVADWVQDVASLLRPKAQEKHLALQVSSTDAGWVRTDAAKLRQILFNLIGNAIKFTACGTVSVRSSLIDCAAGAGARLQLEVADSGVGIAKSDQLRIFDPFFRVESNASQQGAGLGLAITRQYVELLGGSITIESTPGAGSCFRIELPVETVATSEVHDNSRIRPRRMRLAPEHTPYRILIVEDQRTNANILRRTLERAGFLVRIAENGEMGVEIFKTWQPEFIWMDIMMPVMDGKNATREIRKLPGGRDVKIVALSACSFREERAAIMAAGVDEFIAKPCSDEAVVACVARHLHAVLVAVESAASGPPSVPKLPSASFLDLSSDMRTELRQAIVSLDAGHIADAIKRLRVVAPEAADVLASHAEGLSYTSMLRLVELTAAAHAE